MSKIYVRLCQFCNSYKREEMYYHLTFKYAHCEDSLFLLLLLLHAIVGGEFARIMDALLQKYFYVGAYNHKLLLVNLYYR